MSGILIVGNTVKDVFLKLDERGCKVEKDRAGTPWLNLGFNSSTYPYMKHTSVIGGASITQEILTNFGIRSEIMGGNTPTDHRFILNIDEQKVAYLSSGERRTTRWEEPRSIPNWIFVDRSAEMTEELMRQILAYLDEHPECRLAIYVSRDTKVMETRLVERAKIVFAENSDWIGNDSAIRVEIRRNSMSAEGQTVKWHSNRYDLMTHLTINTIASSTFFAALLRGESLEDALKMARKNVETASLDSSLTYSKMKQLLTVERSGKGDIELIAKMLMEPGKGTLAADESSSSITRKFGEHNIPDDAEHHRDFRNLLLSLPHLERYINGVILFDETTTQFADNGQNFVDYLTARGIVPGIKVDLGMLRLSDESAETYTVGLDDLPERLARYHEMGLRFAKWRSAFTVSATIPSTEAIEKNCEDMATYARLCQEAGLVPMVEPEILYDGNYSLRRCAKVAGDVLDCLFKHLREEAVDLKACILKTSMVMAGQNYSIGSTAGEVGRETIKILNAHVPAEIAGVVFLSGGQSAEQSTENLQAIINYGPLNFPLSFSFSRALTSPALATWRGDNANFEAAQNAFLARLEANCSALEKK